MSAKCYLGEVLRLPSVKPWWLWILLSPVFVVLCDYLAVAPIGSWIFLWFKLSLVFVSFGAFVAVVVLPFFLFNQSVRKSALAWLLASLYFLPMVYGGLIVGNKVRKSAFYDLAERSNPLVMAISDYADDHGAPPESLDALVPNYLSKVPKTGMMAYPEYRYIVGEEAESFEGNPWVLRVYTPSGGINFDEFMYFPLQNYPDNGYGGWFEKMGQWAYLHE